MRAFLLFLTLLFFSISYSQCVIYGKSELKQGEPEYYTPNIDAKCSSCYSWTVSGGNLNVESPLNKRDLKAKGVSAGETTLSIVVSTKQGDKKCSKTVKTTSEVFVPTGNDADSSVEKTACSVDIQSITESKLDENTIQFSVQAKGVSLSYAWVIVYKNGDKKESSDASPKFPFYKDNDIVSIQVKITSGLCSGKMNKTYGEHFWPTEIPQRTYQQGSYTEYAKESGEVSPSKSSDSKEEKSK